MRTRDVFLSLSYIFTVKLSLVHAYVKINNALICLFPDKPRTPTLSVSSNNPSLGEDITLTCSSSSRSVNKYQFFYNGQSLQAAGTSKSLTVKTSDSGNQNGNYTCKVFIDTISSDSSGIQAVVGEDFARFYICFYLIQSW